MRHQLKKLNANTVLEDCRSCITKSGFRPAICLSYFAILIVIKSKRANQLHISLSHSVTTSNRLRTQESPCWPNVQCEIGCSIYL